METDLPRLHRVKLACIWLVGVSEVSLRSAHPFVLQFEHTINQVLLFFVSFRISHLKLGGGSV